MKTMPHQDAQFGRGARFQRARRTGHVRNVPHNRRIARGCLAPLACLCIVAASVFPAAAQEKALPETQTPYDVQVVLHIVENRFLTPLFQDQFQEELRGRLQLTLGKLAKVSITRTHRLLAEIESEGLGPVLDAWDELSPTRTCFVLLEYERGRYHLRLRQHDGFTGQCTAPLRQVSLSDRSRLSQTASALIRQDFSLVGTVAAAEEDEVTLSLRGGELAGDLSAWVQPGRVFGVTRLAREGERLRSTRLPWACLQAGSVLDKGQVRCKLWRRFVSDDLQPAAGVTYRCVLLPAVRAPVRLRFVDEATLEPRVGLAVHVLSPGDKEPRVKKSTDSSGLVEAPDEFSNMVLVHLPSGSRMQVIPVALSEDRLAIIPLRADVESEGRVALEYRVRLWERRALENLRLSTERLREINEQILRSFADALAAAKHASKSLEEEIDYLDGEKGKIQRQAGTLKIVAELDRGDAWLRELRQRHKEMQERAGRYEEVLKETKEAKALGLKGLLEAARTHEDLAEFDQAIALYDTLLKASPGLSKVEERLAKLREAWALSGPEHKEARRFLLETWPRVEVMDLDKHLPVAKKSLEVLKGAGDRLTPIRMVKANVTHGANLSKKLEALGRVGTDDSINQAKVLRRVGRDLLALDEEARVLAGMKAKK